MKTTITTCGKVQGKSETKITAIAAPTSLTSPYQIGLTILALTIIRQEIEQPLTFQHYHVRWALQNIDSKKAAGPDGLLGTALKVCADQLAAVLSNILNQSLQQPTVPTCRKTATMVHMPKTLAVPSLND